MENTIKTFINGNCIITNLDTGETTVIPMMLKTNLKSIKS